VIRDGSLPLTLEGQSTTFGEIPEGMIVAKIAGPSAEDESRLDDVNQTSDGGERPPVLGLWQVANTIPWTPGTEWSGPVDN
jgi:hypothetical protein